MEAYIVQTNAPDQVKKEKKEKAKSKHKLMSPTFVLFTY